MSCRAHTLAAATALVAVAVMLAHPATGLGSEPELFGLGARSPALAGTGAADADGYDAAYLNPAGLVEATRRRLTLGYVLGRYDLSLDGKPRDVDGTNGVVLGAALPIPFGGALADRVSLGLAFYFPTGLINRARSPFPSEARLAILDDRTQVVSVVVAGGFRVSPRVSVGAGVIALAALVGEIRIAPDAGGHISTVAEEQLIVHYSPVVGVRVGVTPSLKVGVALRGESVSDYDIRVTNSLGSRLPITLPTLRIVGVAQYDPLQVAAEAAWRSRGSAERGGLALVGGLTWKHWSAFPLPSGNATPGAPPQAPPSFHDTVVPRLAVELGRHAGRVTLQGRAGYLFEWSPAPSNAATPLVDANRHVFTVGGGLALQGTLSFVLDVFAQWHQLAGDRAGGGFLVAGGTLGIDL